jgi:hypothetical protein
LFAAYVAPIGVPQLSAERFKRTPFVTGRDQQLVICYHLVPAVTTDRAKSWLCGLANRYQGITL